MAEVYKVVNKVRVRDGPDKSATKIGDELKKGTEVRVEKI